MPQTNYDIFMEIGLEGQCPNTQHYYKDAGIYDELVNGEAGVLPFGRVVLQSATGELTLPTATGQTPAGVTKYTNTYEKDQENNAGYPADRPAAIRKKGPIFMIVEDAMSAGETPFFRFEANASPAAFEAVGRIRSDADTDKADLFTGATVMRDCVAGQVVPVELDL